MKDKYKREKDLGQSRRQIAAEYLSASAIGRKTASEALQHPATLLPLAVSIISVVYLLLLSPIFGSALGAIILASISGTAAAVSYYSRYTKEYPRLLREQMDRLEQERAQLEEAELKELCETLQTGFFRVASAKGLKALAELVSEFEQLRLTLGQQKAKDLLSVSLIHTLAGETYRQGLGALADALALAAVINAPGREKLEKDIAELEKEVKDLEGDDCQIERLRLKKEALHSHLERLDMLNGLELYIDQLLYEAKRCESALYGARMELAAVRADISKTNVDSVIEALQGTIHHVKEVQDELKRLGY